MKTTYDGLAALGWNRWFAQRAAFAPGQTIARVAAVDRDQWLLVDQTGHFRAVPAGNYRQQHPLPHEKPCVGDWVCVLREPGGPGTILGLVERRTVLRRKAAGTAVEYQMIAANVDNVMIVQSCHFDFNLKRLERYLVMVMDGGAEPCILLTKTDLVEAAILASQVEEIRSSGITAPIVTLSNITGDGVEALEYLLEPGKTYCFVGSSGVGKSTLINHLAGSEMLDTREVSGTGEGRHTTVRRELIHLKGGALVIDNPGMREFGLVGAEEGIRARYAEIAALAARCRYRDCSHSGEPGCAVLAALNSDEIDPGQLENYRQLRQESEFNDLSYVEKRKKDRDFGRFIKSAKKSMKRY
ncbi:MAG: ribosome small subunit-dependent GTPase A [Candidatus Aminicenantes bacterium]|nr:ribosome small subunit-dependent GTPase A [Candidatus Aminicenantes bacterium]